MTNSDNKKSRDVLYKEFNNRKAFFKANFFSLIERQYNACTRSLTYNEVECWAILYQAKNNGNQNAYNKILQKSGQMMLMRKIFKIEMFEKCLTDR